MAGIKDVARVAGVSAATVSRALSGNGSVSTSARERVTRAARDLGFVLSYPASALASGRSRNIGVVLPFISRWYFSTVLEGIASALTEAGYDLTLYNFQKDKFREKVLTDFLQRNRTDGLIAVALQLDDQEIGQLRASGLPTVGVGGPLQGIPTIRIDDRAVSRQATDHLIGLGHTRISHIGGENEEGHSFPISLGRRAGYTSAMQAASLPVLPAWSIISDYTTSDAYRQAKQLLADPVQRPTAFFCASDEMAMGAMMAARDLGLRVPDDLSVIGIDGHETGDILGLTTLDQSARQQGVRAVHRLLGQLGPTPADVGPADEILPARFLLRTSTAAPRRDQTVTAPPSSTVQVGL
ncbi:MAG: transcriptional regulator, LacI family [Micrococcaceae bacterium]|nr:transcriptional regulator, LacI family [Micrococcaceae bacterium]